MKKIFLSAVIALALSSYSYAQDEDEYEEEEAPAKVTKAPAYEEEEEEEEAPAPAPKKAEKKKEKKSSNGAAFFGAGIDVAGMLNNNQIMHLTFRLGESMELTALLGFWHHGESTYTYDDPNTPEAKGQDNNTFLGIGVGFDFFITKNILPVSVGGEVIYLMPRTMTAINPATGEKVEADSNKDLDFMRLNINILAGAHAELISGLVLTGKIGLAIDYASMTVSNAGPVSGSGSYLDFGLATKVYLTWFMF